jgi:hypothetical protein
LWTTFKFLNFSAVLINFSKRNISNFSRGQSYKSFSLSEFPQFF